MIKDGFFALLGYIFGKRRRYLGIPDAFRRKIVITIHPWAVPFICISVALPIVFSFTVVGDMVLLGIAATALVMVWRMAKIVQGIKYDVHHILNGIEDDLEAPVKEDKPERITLKRMNGQRSTRVSEPR